MACVPDNFMGLPDELSAYAPARVAVLPVPYDATTSFMSGTRHGPRAIIAASQQVEWYDHELRAEFVHAGITTLAPVEPSFQGPAATALRIAESAAAPLHDGKFLLALGGEHAITAPLVRAVAAMHPELSVLQIDAHADLRDSYQGSEHSHACVMRRIHELGVPFVGAGIRSFSLEEAGFMEQQGIEPLTPAALRAPGGWQRVLGRLTDQVYLTLDIDGLDPAFAPGTGTPEPGGLSWDEVVELIRQVVRTRRIVAADVVEVTPIPGQVVTEFLAARLAYKLLCLVQAGV